MDDDDILIAKVEYCDRCPGRATYIAYKDDLDLALCDHHAKEQGAALKANGFGIQVIPGVRTAPVG